MGFSGFLAKLGFFGGDENHHPTIAVFLSGSNPQVFGGGE